MPPRFAYWTILAGGLPTSFRAADKDELMPTFRRLKEKHPDAEMKYFARGQLWESAEDAKRALRGAERGDRRGSGIQFGTKARGRDWRPGGDHRDPRQPFKDAKRDRNQQQRQRRWTRQHDRDAAAGPARPHGDPLAPRPERRAGAKGSRQGEAGRPATGRQRAQSRAKRFDRPDRTAAPRDGKPSKPHGDVLRDRARPRGVRKANEGGRARRHDGPPHPPRPDREPPPGQDPKPDPPPRPSEPQIKPPGPPERGAKRGSEE